MAGKRRGRGGGADAPADGGTGAGSRIQVRKPRRDGWTAARRATFFAALAETANVTIAADAAGMARNSAYLLKKRDPAFDDAWQDALIDGVGNLELRLLERAMNGDPTPYFHGGEEKGQTIHYPDRVAMFLVSRHLPKDGAGDRSAADRLAARRERERLAREALEAKLDEIEQRNAGG